VAAVSIDIYLVRHATPDFARTDIPYDVPPGPPLTAEGEDEARRLGEFLRGARIARVYASAFERAARTAHIASSMLGLAVATEHAIGEWHVDERAGDVVARVTPVLARVREESLRHGPVCLVSHGGTIGVMLRKLGMPRDVVDAHRARHGGSTPAPPAGVWRAFADARAPAGELQFELVFVPG
jgi:probable phosphoglycerate mutase